MTKPVLYGCIKKQKNTPTLNRFNRILDAIEHTNTIGHLFTVDIKFNYINKKTLLFNEIYPPIFEKNKKVDPYQRSSLQTMSIVVKKDDKDEINSHPYNSKMHSTLNDKKFVVLYAEDLHFLVSREGWLVTYISAQYTFSSSKKNL